MFVKTVMPWNEFYGGCIDSKDTKIIYNIEKNIV